MKIRVQIYLEPKQDRLLEELAKVRKVSKASLIRESIDRYLEAIPPDQDPSLGLIGLAGKTGFKDLARRHDEYLAKLERGDQRLKKKDNHHGRARTLR
ncbi:CopG family transcriptional regulator [Candidatus Acetothermia bacterium]|nr:CopG family transcriptional regulator [Candidatus Acetothermia bacterium]MBI3460311.1 CopG family transcriptional regulator [Candidatus Acetothermia bacterium]